MMKLVPCILLLFSVAQGFQKEDRQEISRTLKFDRQADGRRLMIDNIKGPITVEGYDGDDVQLQVVRLTKAESDERLKEANEDITLDVKESADRIGIVVEVPWRNRWEGMDDWGYRYNGYEVSFDFRVKVPYKTDLYLRTVAEGDIRVTGVRGDFEVRNVNGGVELNDMGGSGRAGTVNGPLSVSFATNPARNCAFTNVNGQVTASFREPLSADLLFKTFNGAAYTDFDFSPLPRRPGTISERHGKKVYQTGDEYTVRIGNGGPRLAFDTLNGNINIVKHQ